VVGHAYWRVVLPSGEAKGRYCSKRDAIPFAETCVTRLDERYAKTAAESSIETWLTLSKLLRTTDRSQHAAILAALDNPSVIGLHRRGRNDIRLILQGDTGLYARKRSEVHLKEGLTRSQFEDIESVPEQALALTTDRAVATSLRTQPDYPDASPSPMDPGKPRCAGPS
jgi:hypothetical protein